MIDLAAKEMSAYLLELILHSEKCKGVICKECEALARACEYVRVNMFAEGVTR